MLRRDFIISLFENKQIIEDSHYDTLVHALGRIRRKSPLTKDQYILYRFYRKTLKESNDVN